MNTNTAKVIEFPVIEIINGGKKKKVRKDGGTKLTRNNKQEGVSSEVYAFKNMDEINLIIKILNWKIEKSFTNQDKQIARRNKLLFIIGINIGIRASDIRLLRWSNFFDDNGEFREYYKLKPQKTKKSGKFVSLYYNKAVRQAIEEYINVYPITDYNDYLFISREGKPITVQTMWNVIKGVAKEAGVKQNIGTHSLRKTWGYWVWHEAEDKNEMLVLLMKCFSHSSTEVTMKYIGISDEDIRGVYNSINLGCG